MLNFEIVEQGFPKLQWNELKMWEKEENTILEGKDKIELHL